MAVDLNYEKDSKERIPYEHYLEVYQNADPKEISSRCDVPYDAEKQEFTVSLMGVSYRISWPEYNVFHIGDDERFADNWLVSTREKTECKKFWYCVI
mgnify:CR=1 FL=1